jgi:small-conductance mechanosensitive channel
MEFVTSIISAVRPALPVSLVIILLVLALFTINKLFTKREAGKPHKSLWRHLAVFVVLVIGLIIIILASPMKDTQKGQILSLIGILLSAAIALSSTTFLGNAMAGIMLRAVRSFKMGDFIQVGDHFGRVTERGLFHIEIQTEYRDLTTLPNLFLITNPVKVIRSSGTILSTEVSLGYDIPHHKVEKLLLEAAHEANLTDPFVLIMKLGDFSITYRAAGLLTEVKRIISARSRLRAAMLDKLHQAGIEIVSPNVMTTRSISPGQLIAPEAGMKAKDDRSGRSAQAAPEAMVFDKADEAESAQKLQQRLEEVTKQITEHNEQLKKVGDQDSENLRKTIANLEQIKERIAHILQAKADKLEEND